MGRKKEEATVTKNISKTRHSDALRKRAEKKIPEPTDSTGGMPAPEIQKLVHEVTVHQIELEMQNEALRRSQIETAESRYRYSDLYDFAPVGYFTLDKKGHIIEANVTGASLLGAEKRSLAKQPFQRFIIPGHFSIFQSHLQKAHELRSKLTCKLKLTGKDGSLFDALIDTIAVIDGEDKFDHYRSSVTDITEITRAEEALREAEEGYRALASTVDSMYLVDRECRYQFMNDTHLLRLGISLDQVKGRSYGDFHSEEDLKQFAATIEAVFETHKSLQTEHKGRIGDSFFLRTFSPVRSPQGSITAVTVISKDITERKRAEDALQESEYKFRLAMDATNDGLWDWNIVTNEVYRNPRHTVMLGYEPQDFSSSQDEWEKLIHPDDKQRVFDSVEAYLKGKTQFFALEYRLKSKSGDYLWVFGRGKVAEYDDTGTPIRMIGTNVDITERKRAEERLHESEARYRMLFDNAADGIALADTETGQLVDCNQGLCRMVEWNKAELVGQAHSILHPPAAVIEGFSQTFQQHQTVDPGIALEDRLLSKSGKLIPVEIRAARIEINGRDFLIGIFRDITERKRADEAIKTSHQQLRALARRLQSAREDQRKQIAREIHDELGGALTGLKIDLSFLASSAPKSRDKTKRDSFLGRMLDMTNLIDETIGTVRKLVTELRPSILDDFGLLAALEWQLEEFQRRTGVQCKLHSTMAYVNLDEERSIAVFRIFQESLTNVARHANATKVTATLYKEADSLVLKVEDNGKGISEDDIHNVKSVGLVGMRERALFLRGTVNFSGEPSKGTTVSLQFPFGP